MLNMCNAKTKTEEKNRLFQEHYRKKLNLFNKYKLYKEF